VRLSLPPGSRLPESEQLVGALRRRIDAGSLAPGERLPPVRALADELDLSPNTVAKAYRALEREGVLVTRGRRGTFVAESPPARIPDRERRLAEAAVAFARRGRQLGFGPSALRRALDDAVRARRVR
jgi:DNA-binding transcriptional regulator YhcF (GntR family)